MPLSQHLIELDIENEVPKFKPGHRILIIAISKKAKQFLKDKLSTKKNDTEASTLEIVEILTPEEINNIRATLINKLNSSAQQNGLNIKFTENEISAIETYISHSQSATNKPSYKCIVKCALCQKSVPCTHNGHWQTSNLESHLKKEANNITQRAQSATLNLPNFSTNSAQANNLANNLSSELDVVLGISKK